MAAERSSTPSLRDDPEIAALLASPEEAWTAFDAAVRHNLGFDGREFLRRVKTGELVNDDTHATTTFLFMLLDCVPEDLRIG